MWYVNKNNISYGFKWAVDYLDYPPRGIPINKVNTHSICAVGAMVL